MYAGVPIMAPVRVNCASKTSPELCMSVPTDGVTGPVGGPLSRIVSIASPAAIGPLSLMTIGERAAAAGAEESFSVIWRASPKSMTRTSPSRPTITLSGLKSRWTSPFSCAAASPRPAARNTRSTSGHERGCACSQNVTVFPSTNSIAMNTWSRNVPTS